MAVNRIDRARMFRSSRSREASRTNSLVFTDDLESQFKRLLRESSKAQTGVLRITYTLRIVALRYIHCYTDMPHS